jgi:hypothetical protein
VRRERELLAVLAPLGAIRLVAADAHGGRGSIAFEAKVARGERRAPKVARDRLMAHLGERYPGYGFERNKGYWSKEHRAALTELGPTPEHRLSFNPAASPRPSTPVPLVAGSRAVPLGTSSRPQRWPHTLLETPTISDRVWTDEPRMPRETRTAFIRRVLLGETEPVEAPQGETAATETASAFTARPGNR